ncbi:hypothetical protein PybrP1_008174 [[Pythium] brassicae (nom. inval.)]|nr:hypothetical protein PybrP1_008174 [[Pythium] brassicae (nom. inval.)]
MCTERAFRCDRATDCICAERCSTAVRDRRLASDSLSRLLRIPRWYRLLLEEALTRVPLRVVDIVTPASSACEGVTTSRASCGVSISEVGFALLQVFRFIQPTSPSGYITLNAAAVRDGLSSTPTLQKVSVPLDLRTYDVFLMEATCAVGAGACVAIQALLDCDADETTIYFVSVCKRASRRRDRRSLPGSARRCWRGGSGGGRRRRGLSGLRLLLGALLRLSCRARLGYGRQRRSVSACLFVFARAGERVTFA